jgi:hypothetical protein
VEVESGLMAKQITELGASAAVAGADLLWLEQSGLPTKLSFTALQAAMGAPAAGTSTDNTLRWSGSAWVESAVLKTGTSNIEVTSVAPQLYLIETGVTANNTRWSWTVDAETFTGRMWNDANSTQGSWISVARTLNVADSVNLTTALQILTPPSTASASGEIRINARGDAMLNLIADNVSDAETNNPYIRFAQDGAAVLSIVGSVGAADIDAEGNTFTGMPNNGFGIHHRFAAGSIGLGINGSVGLLIDDSDNVTVTGTCSATEFWGDGNNYVVIGAQDSGTAQPYAGYNIDMASGAATHLLTGAVSGVLYQNSGDVRWYSAASQTAGTSATAKMILSGNDLTVAGFVYPGGQTVGYITSVTGQYGSVQVDGADGTAGTWEGYNIAARAVFMCHPTEQRFGLYDDVDGMWALQWNVANAGSSEQLSLYADTAVTARTQVNSLTGNTSGLEIKDYGGTFRDAGFATMEEVTFVANTVVAADHWSQKALVHTNATTHTLTFNTLSTVPDGAVMWVKARTGIVTLTEGTMAFSLYDGSGTIGTANVSIAIGGWATIHKTGDSACDITGVGLT